MPTWRPISPTLPFLYRKLNYNLFQHGLYTIGIRITYGPCFFRFTQKSRSKDLHFADESFPLESKSHTVSMVEFALSQQTTSPAAALWGSLTVDLLVFKFQM